MEATDASGNIVSFGTNLLRAIGHDIVPEDADGVTHATLELQRQLTTFPGVQRGLNSLKASCDRITLLFNDLGLLTHTDQNQHVCSQLDILIISYGSAPSDPVSWNRCKDRCLLTLPLLCHAGNLALPPPQPFPAAPEKSLFSLRRLTTRRSRPHLRCTLRSRPRTSKRRWTCSSCRQSLSSA